MTNPLLVFTEMRLKTCIFQQLDKAVVNLYDNLTKATGKRGDAFIKKKKEGLALLKEAERCYQVRSSYVSSLIMKQE